MVTGNVKSLLAKLDRLCLRLMDAAAGFALARGHYQVEVEHFLLKALEEGQGDLPPILRHFDLDPGRFNQALLQSLQDLPDGNQGRPSFSALLLEMLERAWLVASLELGEGQIRSGHLLLALLADQALLAARDYGEILSRIDAEELKKDFAAITQTSLEAAAGKGAATGKGTAPAEGEESFLAQYTMDFTGQAAEGKLDPVFGRDREIREMIDILARRRKNNPIVVGEAGVGKTAVVEGLALRVVQGDVPELLSGVSILGLDMGLLQAGAGVKGEFERRLKGVIDEVRASAKPIILFIDEAHTIIGAGGPAGGSDAANLLKPALARGELRTIAATTWSEYKKYFEKDVALARRFQVVKLDEPSVEATVDMLRGLKEKYQQAHGVKIRDQALEAAASLASRYISGRQLPDKAVDLVDTAAARVKITLTAKPAELDQAERDLEMVERQIKALEEEPQRSAAQEEELEAARQRRRKLQDKRDQLQEKWEKERRLADKLRQSEEAGESDQADKLRAELTRIQAGQALVKTAVDAESVAAVVTDWTGIPLSRVAADQAKSVLELEDSLYKRIKGQDWAIHTIAQGLRAAASGVKPPNTPMGVFLLVGPSGVGKTETALAIADLLFGGERFLISINMSEFQERHTVSRLIGSPPGYVGYGEGGRLTEAVRQRPYSVVLLDETEKAHPDVLNLFYQVFDKGVLADGEGRNVDFKNTLILLTSNLASDTITQLCETPVPPEMDEVMEAVRPQLSQYFKPALLARMTVVPYLTLGPEALGDIVVLKLEQLKNRLLESQRIELHYDQAVVDQITQRCTEVEEGARNIDHILAQTIMPRIATTVLTAMAADQRPGGIVLGFGDGDFTLTLQEKQGGETDTQKN